MIISRTPFRISFFGGGTDYPVWYKENGGVVLATSIDKYCYISVRYLPPFFDYKSRAVYSKMEVVNNISDFKHPSIRECMRFMDIKDGLEIHHDGDLPARTGLGSSSSFTVGFLNALYALKGKMVSKMKLALDSIYVEQEMIKESVGSQDQIIAAYGGFNLIEFGGIEHVKVYPLTIKEEKLRLLQDHLMLFFTGFSRTASEIAQEQINNISNKKKELGMMYQIVRAATDILNGESSIIEFGKLMHENWKLKKSLSNKISTPIIDQIYDTAVSSGAVGGKLLGAGGGGFILFFVRPEEQPSVRERLKNLLYVPFRFESYGSQISYYNPEISLKEADLQKLNHEREKFRVH